MQSPLKILACRALFFLCAFLPTCLVAAWAVQRSQPVYRNAQQDDWERFLSQRLGVQAKTMQVKYPSYWVARLDGLQLADRESKAKLLECRSIEAARTRTAWLIDVSQPKLHLDHIGELAHLLDQRILREIGPDDLPCEFEIRELTLQFGEQAQTVTQVVVFCRPIDAGAEIVAQFHLAGNEQGTPCRLAVRRLRDGSGEVANSWELVTESVALPCSLISSWVPSLRTLGPAAQFVGQAKGTVGSGAVSAEIQGRFLQVDLDSLVTPHTAHRLSGLAEVTVSPLKIEGGRITELRGTIDSRGGYVSDTLLTAAQEHGHFGADNERVLVQDGLVAYRRLAARFQTSGSGMVIEGIADPTRAGVVLTSATQALLLDPTQQPLPIVAFVRMLVPADELQVPAAQETLLLLQAFPPASVREPTAEKPPRVHVKLHD